MIAIKEKCSSLANAECGVLEKNLYLYFESVNRASWAIFYPLCVLFLLFLLRFVWLHFFYSFILIGLCSALFHATALLDSSWILILFIALCLVKSCHLRLAYARLFVDQFYFSIYLYQRVNLLSFGVHSKLEGERWSVEEGSQEHAVNPNRVASRRFKQLN